MDEPAGVESVTQKQARLRREKREAKIKAGGSTRLDKIASVSGGRVVENASRPVSTPSPPSAIHPDPAEVDLSTHPSATDHSTLTPAQLRDLLSANSPSIPFTSSEATATFPPASSSSAPPPQDPIAAMLQQLLSGAGAPTGTNPFALPPTASSPDGSLPPALASLLSGASASPAPAPPASRLAPLFRALRLFASLAFAMLILHGAPAFDGSLTARAPYLSAAASARAAQAFWGFVAAEMALLSWQGWVEGRGVGGGSGGGGGGGMGMLVGLVAGFLPGMWGQVLRSGMWYLSVVRKGVEDAVVVVFVLGLVTWWRRDGF